jgi:7,8-dihydropterin-6-yl-methyl-4-(beta-D-ribofuranosyl)aminobenzene 5'-phosphate synthase
MPNDTTRDSSNPTRRQFACAAATAPIWLPGWARSVTAGQPGDGHSASAQQDHTVLTIAYDNYADVAGLTTEWGFSCLVEGPDKTILFDTGGKEDVLLSNLKHLDVDLGRIDSVVLSHIHWDHVGGLPAIARDRPGLPVYVPTGFPAEFLENTRLLGAEIIEADQPVDLCPRLRTTGTMGKGRIEEHGLCVDTGGGWVLITGCAHPGIHKMVAQAKEITHRPPRLAVGGFHMLQRSERGVDAIIKRFRELGVKHAAPCHCSGDVTRKVFKERLGDDCTLVGAGHVFRFPAAGQAA